MTWWRNSSRHSNPKTKATLQRRHHEIVLAFATACRRGDDALIARLLTPDVELVVDSGGGVATPAERSEGIHATADLMLRILGQYPRVALDEQPVNGVPGILLRDSGTLVGVVSVGVRRDAISHIWVVLNPDKLVRFDIG